MTRALPSLMVVLSLLAACGPSRRDDKEDPVCDAGETAACTCENGATGKATCLADETGFGVCECAPVQACTPATTQACTCASGFGGLQVCDASGAAWGACVCDGPVSCTVSNLIAAGEARTSIGNVSYDARPVQASFAHRHGEGGGCLGEASIELTRADGACPLSLRFGAIGSGIGGLLEASIGTGGCPGFTRSATYRTPAGYGAYWFTGTTTVTDGAAASVCASGAAITFPTRVFVLRDAGGDEITLNLSSLTITGQLSSVGKAELACVDSSTCKGSFRADETAWCVSGCAEGLHDGGGGSCVPVGTCSSNYHDGGAGTCVPVGQCASGFHDGGAGACTPVGTCASGFRLDGAGACVPSQAQCTQDAPVAAAGLDVAVSVGRTITLDGRASTVSATHAPARFAWTVSPAASLGTPTASVTTFTATVAGLYVATLVVTDARGCTSSDTVAIRVGQGPKHLQVQLVWAETTGDLDLHFLGPNGTYFDGGFLSPGVSDAHWENKNPDWGLNDTTGADNRAENDPALVVDDLWGSGPEEIDLPELFDGVFTAGAHFYCDVEATTRAQGVGFATATLRAYVDGVEIGSVTATVAPKSMWTAFTLTVTGGGTQVAFAPVNTMSNEWAGKGCR